MKLTYGVTYIQQLKEYRVGFNEGMTKGEAVAEINRLNAELTAKREAERAEQERKARVEANRLFCHYCGREVTRKPQWGFFDEVVCSECGG